jgi:hypothetical protein
MTEPSWAVCGRCSERVLVHEFTNYRESVCPDKVGAGVFTDEQLEQTRVALGVKTLASPPKPRVKRSVPTTRESARWGAVYGDDATVATTTQPDLFGAGGL